MNTAGPNAKNRSSNLNSGFLSGAITGKKSNRPKWRPALLCEPEDKKTDEDDENKYGDGEKIPTLDSFYDPIFNLGIGRKGGLIQYLKRIGHETLTNNKELQGGERPAFASSRRVTVRAYFYTSTVMSTEKYLDASDLPLEDCINFIKFKIFI